MSVRVMTAVFDHSQATGNDRLVLLAIADEAKDDGTNAYPGLALLETKTRIPKRTIIRCIERLEEAGELTAVRPETPGRGRFTVYTVLLPGIGDTLTPIPDEKGRGKVPDRCQIGDTPPPLTSTDAEYAVRGTQDPKRSKPERGSKSSFPASFVLTAAMKEWAATEVPNVDLVQQTRMFADHFRGNGERKVDWVAAWRNWMRRSVEFAPRARSAPPGHYVDTTEESMNQILARQNGGRPSPW